MLSNWYFSFLIYFVSQIINNFVFIYFGKINFNSTLINDYNNYNILTVNYTNDYYDAIVICNSLHICFAAVLLIIMCNMHNVITLKTFLCEMSISLSLSLGQIITYNVCYNNISNSISNLTFLNHNNYWTTLNLSYVLLYNFVILVNYCLIKIYHTEIIQIRDN